MSRLRIHVDRDLCEANAICVKNAPAVFRLDDTDKLHLRVQTPSTDQLERVHRAIRRCPRRALSLREDDEP